MPHTGSNDTSLHPAVPFHPTPRAVSSLPRPAWPRLLSPATPVESLAQELAANRNLLTALAGPGITLGMSVSGGRHPVAMTGDDLTRVLVNLVKNAAEAMPHGGHMQIGLEELGSRLHLTVEDSGPGIPETALPHIFTAGYTTHVPLDSEDRESEDSDPLAELWTTPGRGLGLAIVHSLVTAAGGRVWAANRNPHGALGQPATSNQPVALRPQAFDRDGHNWSEPTGARIHIELPIVPNSLAVT
jgi:signal transduction histidine kinase